jgi:transmembrane sensor
MPKTLARENDTVGETGSAWDIPVSILEQAADHMLRFNEAGGEPGSWRIIQAWRAADPRHEAAWTLARATWAEVGTAAPARLAVRASPPPVRRPWIIGLAAAAVVAMLAFLPAWEIWLSLRADVSTGTSESRVVALADGSRIVLGAETALNTDLSAGLRSVSLLSGEAFFQVAHDGGRPFVVHGSGVTVTVTGTAFDVSVGDGAVLITVAEGSVRVAHGGTEDLLTPGQGLSVDTTSGAAARRSVDPSDVASWRGGRLIVGDRPLAEVLETLRRHHRGLILLAGRDLARRRVTGVYDLSDPERALRALVGPYGATVHRLTPLVLVVSPA